MLNGIAPVIIFVFKKEIFGFKVPFMPIPLYLDERLTGIIADEHSRHLSVEVEQVGNESYERTTSSDVQISFIAKKSNVGVTAALALFEQVMKYVNKQDYSIILYYDDVFMLDASLKDFETEIIPNSDTRQIRLTLSNRPPEKESSGTVLKYYGDAVSPF